MTRLRQYLVRGGFLVIDDFYGPFWHVLYDINERFFIASLRHLGIGRGIVYSTTP